MSQISIIGTGYVGLCSAAGFSSLGHRVRCFDIDKSKIEQLNKGIIPIHEENLPELIKSGLSSGNLSFHDQLDQVISEAEFVFICVPTPQNSDGAADLSYVLSAAKDASRLMKDGSTIVVKSTVPVGASIEVSRVLGNPTVDYVSNPEFLREGSAMWDFFNPDRIVAGSSNKEKAEQVANLYKQHEVPTIITSAPSAELIKYAANAFLAIKISFVNEIAAICEQTDADVEDVTSGFGLDSRIGNKFLKPGPGWGGSCFPKDTRALLSISESVGVPSQLVSAAIQSNNLTYERTVSRLRTKLSGNLRDKKIAVWGIAFKANTDDTRESPSLRIISKMIAEGAVVSVFDPIAVLPEKFSTVNQFSNPEETLFEADALIVLTEWPEFHSYDGQAFSNLMSNPLVFDTRRILNHTWDSCSELIKVGR